MSNECEQKLQNKKKIFFYRYEHLLFSAIITRLTTKTKRKFKTKINSIIIIQTLIIVAFEFFFLTKKNQYSQGILRFDASMVFLLI